MSAEFMTLDIFGAKSYRKCECCNRVKDIYYRLNVKDFQTSKKLVGSFDLCRFCGDNFGKILGDERAAEAVASEEFSFDA